MSYAVSTFGLMSFDLNTFDEVKKHYESIVPINSKVNPTSDDIRPIADRKRKYERIMKFSETCYALLDGDGYADSMTNNWVSAEERQKCRDNVSETLTFAPVVWTRHDGYDTIRIRNGSGDYAHTSRYSFIARCLPRAMRMTIGQGKQYIVNKNDKQYLLPKSDFYTYRNGEYEEYPEKGHRYLTFEIVHGENVFSIIDGEFVVNPKRTAVNKELKAKYKKGIDSMWEYVCTVAPMFNNIFGRNVAYSDKWQLQHAFHDDAKQEVQQWELDYMNGKVHSNRYERHLYIQDPQAVYGHGDNHSRGKYENLSEREKQMWRVHTRTRLKPHHTELILEDDEHPLKLVLAKEIISDIPELTDCEGKDEAKKLRSRYNRWFNNHLVLVETVAHETITKRYTSQNPATSKGRK
mgnify:CR=1 FL=1